MLASGNSHLPVVVRQAEEGAEELARLCQVELQQDVHAEGEELPLPQPACKSPECLSSMTPGICMLSVTLQHSTSTYTHPQQLV